MLNRLFGNYLVNTNHLSDEQLKRIYLMQEQQKAGIDTIAVVLHMLAPVQVQQINESMLESGIKRFGDAAIEAGVLTDEEVERILTYRKNPFMTFIQALLSNQYITLNDMERLLMDFQSQNKYTDEQLGDLLENDLAKITAIFLQIQNPHYRELFFTLIKTMQQIIDSDLYLEAAQLVGDYQSEFCALQNVTGDLPFTMLLSGTGQNLLAIANHFTDAAYEEVNLDALDTVGEFINCVNGLFATTLSYEGLSIDMEPPEYSIAGKTITARKIYVLPIHVNNCIINAVIAVKT